MQAPQLSKHTSKEIRQFGHVMLVAGLAACIALSHKAHWQWTSSCTVFFIGGIAIEGLCSFAPKAMRYPYHAWMLLAFGMSYVMSRIVLTTLFAIAIVPVGLLLRAFGKDPLQRQLSKESYWQHNRGLLPHDHYENLFTVKARISAPLDHKINNIEPEKKMRAV